MNKLTPLFVSCVVLFITVDLLPLNDITSLLKRSENSSQISPEGNSSTLCNSTVGDCNNSTKNYATQIHLNLSQVCQQNATGLKVRCNGTLVNFTKHCENGSIGNISLYCVNESNNVSVPGSNVSMASNDTRINSTSPNATAINVHVAATISPSQTTGISTSTTPSLSVTSSPSYPGSASVSQELSTTIQPSSSSAIAMSSSVQVANTPVALTTTLLTTQSTTPQSTTTLSITPQSTTPHSATPQSTTPQSATPQSTTTQSATPQSTTTQSTTTVMKPTTPESTTAKPSTHESTTAKPSTHESTTAKPTTPPTTPLKEETFTEKATTTTVETEVAVHKSTSTELKTEHSNTVATMQSPYNSAKNIKFFYVNVLIPVGAGVCGALLIAFSVILFKCCRKRKLKKVRYFGKPRGRYSRNNMDHMNLLANSSDEE